MLNIALPKGRLGDQVYGMLKKAGYPCPALEQPDRRLIFENEEAGVRYFWVKPHDVTIYVERGAADIGIAGKDILLEYSPELYELLDLKAGKCRMCVAGPADFRDNRSRILRVATKFPRIAGDFYAEKSRDVELRTLFENGLTVLEEVCPISARLVANPAAYRFRREEIDTLTMRLGAEIKVNGEGN